MKKNNLILLPGFLSILNSITNIFPTVKYIIADNTIEKYSVIQCPICMKIIKNTYRPNSCSHIFCRKCLLKSSTIKMTCPISRQNFHNLIKN